MFPSTSSPENIEILGKQNRCFPREQSLVYSVTNVTKAIEIWLGNFGGLCKVSHLRAAN